MNRDDSFLDDALATAREAADAAARVIAPYWRGGVEVEHKADATPVTVADREAELAIKAVIRAKFPAHGFHGEEFGTEPGDGRHRWLVDPIDGTKSFVRRNPFFSTQVALMRDHQLVLGVSSAPHFGETAWARRGGGAWLDGARIRCAATARIADAAISFGNLKTLARSDRWSAVAGIVRDANRTRGYGDFYHYHLLARGAIDAVVESDVNILDIAPLVVILREAGALFTDLEGREPGLDTTSVLAAVPAVHAELLRRFASGG
ncbi:MAG TPA: inositol monophosphatase family protein [Xanthomonadales bacterium]|nr:inositol monophosphatase family protein [Xanthomonadales bacterium]